MMKKHHHMQNMAPGFHQSPQSKTPQLALASQPSVLPSEAGNSVAASVPAKSDLTSDNPYQSIVTRNVFGLNPIPPADPVQPQLGPPPPKITLTGITTIFGPAEALFKVAGVVRSGGPPKDEYYTFTEGEEQDEVQVTKIDTQKNIVSFVNHGVTQEIPLTDGVASTGQAPAPTFPGQMHRFGRFGGPATPGGNAGSPPPFTGYRNAALLQKLSGDDQQALIAAQHAQWQQDGNPAANLFPPTKFDNDAGIGAPDGGGGPGGPPGP